MVARLSRHRPIQIDQNGLNPAGYQSFYWRLMVILSDWVLLVRTFFWMLYSMSNRKLDVWRNISDSLSQTIRPTTNPQVKAVSVSFNIGIVLRKYAINLDYLSKILEKKVAKRKALKSLQHSSFEDHLTILLSGDGLLKFEGPVLVGNV